MIVEITAIHMLEGINILEGIFSVSGI